MRTKGQQFVKDPVLCGPEVGLGPKVVDASIVNFDLGSVSRSRESSRQSSTSLLLDLLPDRSSERTRPVRRRSCLGNGKRRGKICVSVRRDRGQGVVRETRSLRQKRPVPDGGPHGQLLSCGTQGRARKPTTVGTTAHPGPLWDLLTRGRGVRTIPPVPVSNFRQLNTALEQKCSCIKYVNHRYKNCILRRMRGRQKW